MKKSTNKSKIISVKKDNLKLNKFDVFIGKYKIYLSLSIVIFAGIIVFKEFLFLKSAYLFKDIASDSINGYFPFLSHYNEYLKENSFWGWSFNIGMGQSIVNLITAQSDITYFISSFLTKSSLPFIANYIEFFKLIVTAIFFYLYLKNLKLSPYVIVIGSLILPFSSFFIIGGNWQIFSSQVFLLAMLLFALEKLYSKKMYWFFPIVIFLISITQIFSLYVYGVFIFIYTLFRILSVEDRFDYKKLVLVYFNIFVFSVLGFLLSSFFTFNVIHELINGPRVGGESSYFKTLSSVTFYSLDNDSTNKFGYGIPFLHLKTLILRFFSSDILGTGLNYKGWYNYMEAPMSYIGLITLILFPQIFQFLNKKQKIVYSSFLGFWILICVFPFFRYAFWLFTGDYYRILSLFVSFFLLFFALNALSKIDSSNKISIKTLIITTIVLLILLFFPYFSKEVNVINKEIQNSVAFFLISYTILLYVFTTKFKQVAKILIILLVFIEVVSFSNTSLYKRDIINRRTGFKENANVSKREIKQKIGYNDFTNDAMSFISEKDKGFFRVNKEFPSGLAIHSSMNDAMVFNFYGTQSYSSFNQKYYINFLSGFNIIDPKIETQTRWAQGLNSRPILQTLASTKYQIRKSSIDSDFFIKYAYDSIKQFGDVKLLQIKHFLPLGFCYDKYISSDDFKIFSDFNKDVTSLKALVIDTKGVPDYKKITDSFTKFSIKDTINVASFTFDKYFLNILKLKEYTLKISNRSQNEIKGEIEIKSDKILFFSIPYDEGWKAKVDGNEAKINIVDFGLMGIYLEKGKHKIELVYEAPWFKYGKIASLAGLFIYLILFGYNIIKKRQTKLTAKEELK